MIHEIPRRRTAIRHTNTFWLSVMTLVGVFVINTLGFTDTITGSSMGCGRDWPLCNGQVIPSIWNMATFIEYTHRLSVVVGGVLLIWFSVVALRKHGRKTSVRMLVLLALLGVVLEGILGALAVLFVNPPAVMAAHLGIALITFTAMVLLTAVIRQLECIQAAQSTAKVKFQRSIRQKKDGLPGNLRSDVHGELRSFSRQVWWSIPYGYAAIYVGAYVASTGYGGIFQGWPLPTESLALAGPAFWVDILHRSIALGYLLWMGRLAWISRRFRASHRRYFVGSCAAFVFVCLQAATGALLIETHLSEIAFLLHVTNVSFLFATQCYLGFTFLGERAARHLSREVDGKWTQHRHIV